MSKSFLKMTAIFVFGAIAVYSLLLVPLYEIISCDIMLKNSLWFDVVDLLVSWAEILGLVLMLSFLLCGVYHAGDAKRCGALYYILGGALLFKYVAAIVALSVVHGTLDFTLDYSGYLVSLLLELIPLVAVTVLTHRYTVRYQNEAKAKIHAAKVLGEEMSEGESPLPFGHLFDRQNPLQIVAYIGACIVALEHLAAFVASEIAYTMLGAAFRLSDLPVTLLYAVLLVLLPAFLGYIVLFYTVCFLERKCFS